MKTRNLLFVVIMLFLTSKGFSQVKDVSITVSPMAEYTWWDKNLTLDNSTFWGGRVGFGFGPLFEMRGFYQKSFDVKAALRDINWKVTDDWADKMTNSHVDISRYGGELKLNLIKNSLFAPYITAGGGVQTMKYELASGADPNVMQEMKEEQLFGALGLGTKINLSDRLVLSLEAKNTFFNVNDQSYYLSPDFNPGDNNKRLYNWSAMASLDFYFGGTSQGNSNEVERAYHKLYSDGFSGMKFVLEPGGAYINFNDESMFADQYFLGASAGFDLSSLVGVRGFYYRATEQPDKLSTNLNKELSMYGGNIIARLNQPRGINPYLTLGGGYLKVGDEYVDKLGLHTAESTPFALGGVGVEIPFSKFVALYGSINAMLTSQKAFEDVQNPSQIITHTMYQAGVRFNLGQSVDADNVYRRNMETRVNRERDDYNNRINEMRAEYESRIEQLNEELDMAAAANDTERAEEILEEKVRTERVLDVMEKQTEDTSGKLIKMSSEDFEKLIERILREVRKDNDVYPTERYYDRSSSLTPLEERLLQQLQDTETEKSSVDNAIVSDQLKELNQKLDRNFNQMTQLSGAQPKDNTSTIVISDKNTPTQPVVIGATPGNYSTSTASSYNAMRGNSFFKLNRLGLFTGIGFGDNTSFNLGVRGYLQISDTSLDFVPEVYASMGDKNGIGVSGNVFYNFENAFGAVLNPYVGLGLGIFPGEKTHVGSNIILGTSFDLAKGSLFVDYSIRSLFKQNQLAVGYRFVF